MMTRDMAVRIVLAIARMFLYTREAGANRGATVEAILKSTGNAPGESWCASFVWWCVRVIVLLFCPKLSWMRTASCDALLEAARVRGLLRDEPAPGYLCLVLKTETDAIHVTFVDNRKILGAVAPGAFPTIEGNTNIDGSSNGIGVFERVRGGPDDKWIKAGHGYVFVDWASQLAA
jgi:hypothetical protein